MAEVWLRFFFSCVAVNAAGEGVLLLRVWWDGSVWFGRGLPRCVRMHGFGVGMGGLAFV